MMELLNELEPLLRTFWLIAIPTSIFFALQTIMTFFGADGDGMDADFDARTSVDLDASDISNAEVNKEDVVRNRRKKLKWWQIILVYFRNYYPNKFTPL